MTSDYSVTAPNSNAEATPLPQRRGITLGATARRRLTRMAFWAVTLFAAGGLFYSYLVICLNSPAHEELTALVTGEAAKPFVLRFLVPFLMREMMAFTPLNVETAAAICMTLSLLGFLPAFRYLLAAFDLDEKRQDRLTIVAVLGLAPLLFTPGKAVYDLTTLFLFTLALALLARRRWLPYLAVFVLATLNRETSILLLLVFVAENICREDLTSWRTSRQLRRALVQLVIYGVIRLAIIGAFWGNSGTLMQYHLDKQLTTIVAVPGWIAEGTLTDWLLVGMLIGGTLLPLLVFYRWSSKPRFLRRAFLAVYPLLYVLFLIGGMPFETRVFIEAYPVLVLLLLWTG